MKYILHTRKNQVMAFVKNTTEIREEIREWNKNRTDKNTKLRVFGRGPSSKRNGDGMYDIRLGKAKFLAVYMSRRTKYGSWNVVPSRQTAMPLFLRNVCL